MEITWKSKNKSKTSHEIHTLQGVLCSKQVALDEKQTECEQSDEAVLSVFDKISDNPESKHEEFHEK